MGNQANQLPASQQPNQTAAPSTTLPNVPGGGGQAPSASGALARDSWKTPARVATTTTLPTYTRSGNVLTASANGALPAIDGVTLVNQDRLLLQNGAAAADNGIYVVTQIGTGGTPWILTRASDADDSSKVQAGMTVDITEGSTQGGRTFYLATTGAIVLNTTAMNFSFLDGAFWKMPVLVSTITTLPAYTRTGNSITANANGVIPTVDGVTLVVGDRILLAHGAAGADNGIYVITSIGAVGAPWSMTRAPDCDTSAKVRYGMRVIVQAGAIGNGLIYALKGSGAITLNTTALGFNAQQNGYGFVASAAAEAGNARAVSLQLVDAANIPVPKIQKFTFQILDAAYLQTVVGAWTGTISVGTAISTNARPSGYAQTDANGACTLTITDVSGAAVTTVYLEVCPVNDGTGPMVGGNPTVLAVAFA